MTDKLKGFEPVAFTWTTHSGEVKFAQKTDWDCWKPLYPADQLAAVVQQRDELLAAVNRLLLCDIAEVRNIEGSPGAIRTARTAIAKVQS